MVMSYVPPALILGMPYLGVPVKPGARPTQIVLGIVLAVALTLWNVMIYKQQKRREKLFADIRSRGTVNGVYRITGEEAARIGK